MKIARILGADGPEFVVGDDGATWRSIRPLAGDVGSTGQVIAAAPEIRGALASGELPIAAAGARLLSPIVRPGKIVAVGLNYRDHIRETGTAVPERPVIFAKFPSALSGPFAPIVVPYNVTSSPDYESELAVVIAGPARNVSAENGLDAVFGYCVANDVSARDLQANDLQLSRSKSIDTFCPMGPWITTADEVANPQALRILSFVNDEPRQDSTTAEMLFPVTWLIEYLSAGMTLEPGDVILTGTPHGVGFARKPPIFLAAGDVVRCEIEGLGAIVNAVRAGVT